MAGINDYSNTAGSNTTINGIDIAEGCSPAGINNAIRQLMADIADMDDGVVPLQTPDINGGTIDGAVIGGTTPAAGTFTNLTATGTLTGLLGNVVEDVTPQLGGDLDLNSNDITGTGNINITGNITASGNLAGTLTTASQPNITSVGTLTSATVSGDLTVDTNTLYVDSTNNRVGIGTTSPDRALDVRASIANNYQLRLGIDTSDTPTYDIGRNGSDGLLYFYGNQSSFTGYVFSGINGERMRIDSSGNVGIGTSSPSSMNAGANQLVVGNGSTGQGLTIYSSTTTAGSIHFADGTSGDTAYRGQLVYNHNGDYMAMYTAASERMRITSSGNVGIGTSSPTSTLEVIGGQLRVADSSASSMFLVNPSSTYADGVDLQATYNGGGSFGPMKFTTSGLERMRITPGGQLVIANDSFTSNEPGTGFGTDGFVYHTIDGAVNMTVNRQSSDGTMILFQQDGANEGSISVSGSTVSYNGGHLSRWSQLTTNTRDENIVKGTVMSNLDEMCVWGDEDNEQLNKMKVSDTEGDDNVAGVFVNWDNDDDVYTNDMNIAMTGDMVIRIAQGVPVHKGQLLMSAGDGTAKPQGDDIVRSKTIAKVTSNNVTKTYDDGSYLVPCVLMAC